MDENADCSNCPHCVHDEFIKILKDREERKQRIFDAIMTNSIVAAFGFIILYFGALLFDAIKIKLIEALK